jgi:hypothetical protein
VAALKKVAEQAPHGKGAETIVDRTVRDTLQINADQVHLQNPRWNEKLKKLVQTAADALGVAPDTVQAHLYKLLLYETGGFFMTEIPSAQIAHGIRNAEYPHAKTTINQLNTL